MNLLVRSRQDRHPSAQHGLGRAQRLGEHAASIQGHPVLGVTEHALMVQVSDRQALLGALADTVGPQAHACRAAVSSATARSACSRARPSSPAGPAPWPSPPGSPRPPLARRQRHDQRTQPPQAVGIQHHRRSRRSSHPEDVVADAGIVPGDESGSLTTGEAPRAGA